MKKTKLLSLTILTLIGLLGLSSCGKGEKGDKGDTGPAGATGETGPKGDKGEDGKDGIDGSTWLTGSGLPSSSLGKEGDMYLNTTNGDVYQKEDNTWKLKMNIKGEDGSDGEDGKDGLNGSSGSKGETAWSNTILPSSNGYIIPSIGGGVKNTPITFKLFPNDGFILDTLKLNDKEYKLNNEEDNIKVVDNHYELSTTMIENGYVVSATFISDTQTNVIVDGKTYSTAKFNLDGSLNETESTLDSSAAEFEGGDGVNEPLLITSETSLTKDKLDKIKDGLDYKIELNETKNYDDLMSVFSSSVSAGSLEINVAKDTTIELTTGYVFDADEIKIIGEDSESSLIEKATDKSSTSTAYIFSIAPQVHEDRDVKVELENVNFVSDVNNTYSRFFRITNVNNVDINMTNVSYKSFSNKEAYGLTVYKCTGKVNITMDNVNINLSSNDGSLQESYYPIVLEENNDCNLDIKNSEFTGWCTINIISNNSYVTFDNCIFNGINRTGDKENFYSLFVVDGGDKFNPDPGDFGYNNEIYVKNSKININNKEGYEGIGVALFQYGAMNNYIELKDNEYSIVGNSERVEIYSMSGTGNICKVINGEEETIYSSDNN